MSLDPNIQAYHDVYQNYSDLADADASGAPPPPKIYLKVEGGNRMVTTQEETQSSSVDEIIEFSKKLLSENRNLSKNEVDELQQSLMYLGYRVAAENYEGENDPLLGEQDTINDPTDPKATWTPDAKKLWNFIESQDYFPRGPNQG